MESPQRGVPCLKEMSLIKKTISFSCIILLRYFAGNNKPTFIILDFCDPRPGELGNFANSKEQGLCFQRII